MTTKIHIDKTAPKVSYETVEENGRTYLMICAADERQLQGMAVIGIGAGGEAGVYQPGGKKQLVEQINFAQILCAHISGDMGIAGGGDGTAENLPYVLRLFGNTVRGADAPGFNFADVLSPDPDADGVWTVKYDVTDLKNYSFTVMDEAYNYVEIRSAEKKYKSKGPLGPVEGDVRLADRSMSLKTRLVTGPCRAKIKLPAEPVVIIHKLISIYSSGKEKTTSPFK